MAARRFDDRRHAGRVLAGLLHRYRARPGVVVLGLPRGGIPVAYEVAVALEAPLDVFAVRKLGVPGHPELAMGAIASGGLVVLNRDVVEGFGITAPVIERVAGQQAGELRRQERAFRGDLPAPELRHRTVVLVDDGLATGATMRAAVAALRQLQPARTVVAVPAAPATTCRELRGMVDELACAAMPSPFIAVGNAYRDFTQTTDDEVRDLLRAARSGRGLGDAVAQHLTGDEGAGGERPRQHHDGQ